MPPAASTWFHCGKLEPRTGPDASTRTPAEREELRRKQLPETPLAETTLPVRIVNVLEDHGVIYQRLGL